MRGGIDDLHAPCYSEENTTAECKEGGLLGNAEWIVLLQHGSLVCVTQLYSSLACRGSGLRYIKEL